VSVEANTEIITAAAVLITAMTPTIPILMKLKNKAKQLELFVAEINDALEDNKITNEEMKRIIKLGKRLIS